jgi:hypothetical protein
MHQFRRGLTSRQSSPTARILPCHTLRRGQKKWAVSIDSIPLKIARRTLVVKAVGPQAPRSAQRRCWEPAVECSASTIVWPAPYVARTRTCAGDLRIPLILMHTSFRLSLAAPATHLPPELLTPPAGPVRSVRRHRCPGRHLRRVHFFIGRARVMPARPCRNEFTRRPSEIRDAIVCQTFSRMRRQR